MSIASEHIRSRRIQKGREPDKFYHRHQKGDFRDKEPNLRTVLPL